MLPNVVYVGMGKAGSTLLYKLFLSHPDIYVSEINKEINFFSDPVKWDKGVLWYKSMFRGYKGEPWVIDISPGYHNKTVALQRMAHLLSDDLKIIFTFRRFTEFAFSRYLHRIRAKRVKGSFLELLEDKKMFYKPLDRIVEEYIMRFGWKNVLIMHYEQEFNRQSPCFEEKVYEFLGLPSTKIMSESIGDERVNAGYYPRFVYAGNEVYEEELDGVKYRVPKNTLVFCCGRSYKNICWGPNARFGIKDAIALQDSWTTSLDEDTYNYVQVNYTEPLAERLEDRLGISFRHWRVKEPHSLDYGPAPLPDVYIHDQELRAERLNLKNKQSPWI